MLFLWISVFSSVLNGVSFKLFKRFNVDTFQAIIINYFFAFIFGILLAGESFEVNRLWNEEWGVSALLIGGMFIGAFYFMGITAQRVGISITQVASKMAFIVVTIHAYFHFGEEISTQKVIAILIAALAVVLSSISGKKSSFDKKYSYMPIILFCIAGLLDTFMNVTKQLHVTESENEFFLATCFLFSFVIGASVETVNLASGRKKIQRNTVIAGAILGVFNFGSVYFMIRALDTDLLSSTVFPLRNMSVVAVSVVAGYLFFKERYSLVNWIGITLAVLAIYLIMTN